MKRHRLSPQVEGMEKREVMSSPGSLHAAIAPRRQVPKQWQPQTIKGTVFGTFYDNGPGNVAIDTSRPIVKTNSLQSVHGVLTRDVANNKVNGWLIVQQAGGRQVKIDVFGNAGNTSFLGKVVNLKFVGNGEFAQSIRPGNIRLLLNTPLRGRQSLTFA